MWAAGVLRIKLPSEASKQEFAWPLLKEITGGELREYRASIRL